MRLTPALPNRPVKFASRSATVLRAPEECFEEHLEQIIHPGDRVLDAGCGSGKYFRATFARANRCRLIGVDFQEQVRSNSRIEFRVCADLKRLPFPDGFFDVVNCRLVIEHMEMPETALKEFHRVLKPAGRLAIFTPNLLHYFGAAA